MKRKVFFASATLVVVFVVSRAQAAITTLAPLWDGDPQTTYASFAFATAGNPSAPDTGSHNPYGITSVSTIPGLFSYGDHGGWQDPDDFTYTTRPSAGDGAWDLGREGTMTITIPIAPSGDNSPKNVDVFLNFVWIQPLFSIPVYGISGFTPVSQLSEQEHVETYNIQNWHRTVWSASFEDITTDTLTLVLTGAFFGSVVDDLAVYTRYEVIPEPGTAMLSALALTGLMARRKREK